jgi:hypothetical protein
MPDLLEQFAEFARTKYPGDTYDYRNSQQCAVALFAVHAGLKDEYYGFKDEKKIINPDEGYIFTECEIYAATKPHTYGALVERIRDRHHEKEGGLLATSAS